MNNRIIIHAENGKGQGGWASSSKSSQLCVAEVRKQYRSAIGTRRPVHFQIQTQVGNGELKTHACDRFRSWEDVAKRASAAALTIGVDK